MDPVVVSTDQPCCGKVRDVLESSRNDPTPQSNLKIRNFNYHGKIIVNLTVYNVLKNANLVYLSKRLDPGGYCG